MARETEGVEPMAAIMASAQAPGVIAKRVGTRLLLLLLLLAAMGRGASLAQEPSPNQPLAIDGEAALVPAACKLVVPTAQSVLQPLKIRPDQVPLKNRLGCLSPADALYGPDGCPLKLCGPNKGAFSLTTP
ncbi:MAG: hypothetical protein VKP63_10770 [Cyanobacteriota bacterium]|nr:hypothetical protein [Cyanobacteriota bacterium]